MEIKINTENPLTQKDMNAIHNTIEGVIPAREDFTIKYRYNKNKKYKVYSYVDISELE